MGMRPLATLAALSCPRAIPRPASGGGDAPCFHHDPPKAPPRRTITDPHTDPHMAKKKARNSKPRYTAATADRHVLYGLAVQNVEAEIDFVDQTYKELRGRKAKRLREDFCGTANTSAEWVRRRSDTVAVGLDIDQSTLDWGLEHNVKPLSPKRRERITLLNADVMHPPKAGRDMDVILAMNFSYWLWQTRDLMRTYFQRVRMSLAPGGIFFLDHYGGYESMKECRDKRPLEGFTYVWDQHRYNPINGEMQCYIHFHFPDGSKMNKAFEYTWRLWTLPEIRELLEEAGFKNVTVYWEGTDDEGEGNGEFTPADVGEADAAFLTYITAEK